MVSQIDPRTRLQRNVRHIWLNFWLCFRSINSRNWKTLITLSFHETTGETKFTAVVETRQLWSSRVPAHVQDGCSSTVAAVIYVSFIQKCHISPLSWAEYEQHYITCWNGRKGWIASSHPWVCIWKHFKETLEIGNTNLHVTFRALVHVASKVPV